jgi:ubiquinone/menaquinone biosynthesis C-methylase UbiE
MNVIQQTIAPSPDLITVKAKQQTTWAAGNYAVIGTTLQIVGEQLCETIDLAAGSRVLDVAAGNGNATLAAARRCCDVTSTDYVDTLLAAAQRRAEAEGLDVQFKIADAEALPFADESFDVVLSTFGVMFTPDQARAASELVRVCRKGGTIGLANWTPDGFIGQLFKTLGRHLPPPPGLKSPALWGDEASLKSMFEGTVSAITVTPRHFNFRYRSFEHFLSVFRTYYGPLHKAFGAVGDNAQALEDDLRRLAANFNKAGVGEPFTVPSEYVDVVITK